MPKKSVHVRGYTKKNGTNVKPYNRKKPKSSGSRRKGTSGRRLMNSPELQLTERQLAEVEFFPNIGIGVEGYIEQDAYPVPEFIDIRENIWVGSGIEEIAEEEGQIELWNKKDDEFFREVDKIMEKYLGDYMVDASGSGYFASMGETMYVMCPLASKEKGTIENFDEDEFFDKIENFKDNIEEAQREINGVAVKKFPFLKKYMDMYHYNVGYLDFPIYKE